MVLLLSLLSLFLLFVCLLGSSTRVRRSSTKREAVRFRCSRRHLTQQRRAYLRSTAYGALQYGTAGHDALGHATLRHDTVWYSTASHASYGLVSVLYAVQTRCDAFRTSVQNPEGLLVSTRALSCPSWATQVGMLFLLQTRSEQLVVTAPPKVRVSGRELIILYHVVLFITLI